MTASPLLPNALMSRSATASRIAPDATHGTADGTGERWLLDDTRFPPFGLTSTPHANDDAIARMLEKNARLLGHTSRNTDDEITLEAPAPSIPDGVPSPLGEDASVPAPPGPPPPAAPQPTSPERARAPENRMLDAHRPVTPETVQAVRKAREVRELRELRERTKRWRRDSSSSGSGERW